MFIYIHVKPDNGNDNDPLKMKCVFLINTAFLNEYYCYSVSFNLSVSYDT